MPGGDPTRAQLKMSTRSTGESVENLIFLISERFGQAADWAPQLRNQKFADSPLEGTGFEL